MRRVEESVRSAIVRAVRHECRSSYEPLLRDVRKLKAEVARLGGIVRSLQAARALQPGSGGMVAADLDLSAPDEEVRRARLSPARIKAIRADLALTQLQIAALIGVTGPAIAQWEGGTSHPRGRNRTALVALRKLGRSKVRRMLLARGLAPRT